MLQSNSDTGLLGKMSQGFLFVRQGRPRFLDRQQTMCSAIVSLPNDAHRALAAFAQLDVTIAVDAALAKQIDDVFPSFEPLPILHHLRLVAMGKLKARNEFLF